MTKSIKFNKNQHHKLRYDNVLKAFDIKNYKEIDKINYNIDNSEITAIKNKLFKLYKNSNYYADKKLVIIHTGATRITKRWDSQNWCSLVEMIQKKYNFQINLLLIGTEYDKAIINDELQNIDNEYYLDGYNKFTIDELIPLIKEANLFIGCDSGPSHIANSQQVPSIILFGSTEPKLTGPYYKNAQVIIKRMNCSPCFKDICNNKIKNECLIKITPENILDLINI